MGRASCRQMNVVEYEHEETCGLDGNETSKTNHKRDNTKHITRYTTHYITYWLRLGKAEAGSGEATADEAQLERIRLERKTRRKVFFFGQGEKKISSALFFLRGTSWRSFFLVGTWSLTHIMPLNAYGGLTHVIRVVVRWVFCCCWSVVLCHNNLYSGGADKGVNT